MDDAIFLAHFEANAPVVTGADLIRVNLIQEWRFPLVEPDAVYEVSFAGAPKGDYHIYCLPHLALGMRGKVTVK